MGNAKNEIKSNESIVLPNEDAQDVGHNSLAITQAIKKIFQLIEQKDNVAIEEGVKLFSTGFRCDGVIMKGESPCYILVTPRTKLDVLEWKIKRVNELTGLNNKHLLLFATLKKQQISKMSMLVCIYDFDNSAQENEVDIERLRGLVRCHLDVQCFTKADLSEGGDKE